VSVAHGDGGGRRGQEPGDLRIHRILTVAGVDLLIVPGQRVKAAGGAVGRAWQGVAPTARIVVGVVELGYRRARLLPRPAQVLQHERGQGERPPEGVRVATAGIFACSGYLGLIGDAGANADVIHAVVE